MTSKVFRLLFTFWANVTFFILTIPALLYHVVVMLITRGKGVTFLYKCYRPWSLAWAMLNGIQYEITGTQNIQKHQTYIFVCNHGSVGDLVIIAAGLPENSRPLGKVELSKIPVLGYMFKRALVLVDRSSPESRKASLEQIKKLIKKGISVLILPEGTRNRTDKPLKEFYDGAFKLAIECQLPIIPMVILNTRTLYPNDDYLMNHIDLKCIFKEPVSTTGMTIESMGMLKHKIYKIMEQQILEGDELFSKNT